MLKNPIYKFYCEVERERFLTSHNYQFRDGGRYAYGYAKDIYINEEVYVRNGKIYNLLIGREGTYELTKYVNGLKVRKNSLGNYVETKIGKVYLHGRFPVREK